MFKFYRKTKFLLVVFVFFISLAYVAFFMGPQAPLTDSSSTEDEWDETLFGRKRTYDKVIVCPFVPGRLGSQMFAYASCVGIATRSGHRYLPEPLFPLWKYFNTRLPPTIKLYNVIDVTERRLRDTIWKDRDPVLEQNVTLIGYFQDWQYFENVAVTLRALFSIKVQFLKPALEYLEKNVPSSKTRIGIHVRRREFETGSKQELGKVVADKNYFNKSMNFFRNRYPNAYFIVLCDVRDWCIENIFGFDFVITDSNESIEDLAIMSLCDHAIITVGAVSWWTGWLTGGTVVYLKDYPRQGSKLAARSYFIPEEYYPPDWVGMSNKLDSS